MKRQFPLLAAGLVVLPLHAAEPAPAVGQDINAAQRAQFLNQIKTLESDSHQARIQILQQADACIQAAGTPQAYRACEQQEQAARQAYRDAHQSERQAIRDQVRQLRQQRLRARPSPGLPAGAGE